MAHPDASVPSRGAVRRELSSRRAIWWFTLASWLVYGIYCLSRYPQFLTAGYDLGIFDQAVRRYSRFEAPLVALKGDHYNILGDHFHPIIATLAPLYWLWDDPRVLTLAQAALVCLSFPVVHRMMQHHGVRGWVLWALTAGYAFSWPVQRMVDFDFHEVSFAIPLLAVALDGLDRRDDRRFLLGALPLLLVREDMGMVLAMLGVVRAWFALRDRRDARRAGSRSGSHDPRGLQHERIPQTRASSQAAPKPLHRTLAICGALVLLGTVVFFLVIKVVLPHFAADGQFAYWTYDALGPDAPSSIKFILLHPLRTAELFFAPWVKTKTLLYLLLPLALLPLRSPLVLVTLPLLAQRFLSSRTHLWTTEFHYSAPVMVILVFATFDAISRWQRADVRAALAKAVAILLLFTPVFDLAVQGRNYALVRLFYSAWQTKPLMVHQQAVLEHLPAGTCLEVDDRLAAHLTRSNRVTLPTLTKLTSDFVVLDMSQKEVGYPLPSPQEVEQRIVAKGYLRIASEGPINVWQRPGYAGPSAGCAPDAP